MTLFGLPRFMRRFIRRKMRPRTEEQAFSTRDKLAILYAVIAWNGLGLVLWQVFGRKNIHWPVTAGIKDPKEEDVRPAIYYAHLLGVKKASVYQIQGFSRVSDRVDIEVDNKLPLLESYKILNANGSVKLGPLEEKLLSEDFDDNQSPQSTEQPES